MTLEILTPVGRLVWGNPARSSIKKDQKTKQPVLRDGKPVEQWVFGVAFPKAEFNQQIAPYMQQEASGVYPHGVPAGFSWKFKDGDGVDRQGKPYRDREGYAGCFVLTVSTEAFAPPIYRNEGGKYRQIDAKEIKTGDYIVMKLNIKANAPTNPSHTPGLYVNPVGIELVGYGAEIVSQTADPDEMFGGRTYQLPPGAHVAPIAPQTGVMPPYGAPMPPAQPAAMPYAPPQQPQYAPAQPAAMPYGGYPAGVASQPAVAQPVTAYPAPAHDFIHNAGNAQPQQPAAMPFYPGIPAGR